MHVRAQWQCLIDSRDVDASVDVWADYEPECNAEIEAVWRRCTQESGRASPLFEYSRHSCFWRIDTLQWVADPFAAFSCPTTSSPGISATGPQRAAVRIHRPRGTARIPGSPAGHAE